MRLLRREGRLSYRVVNRRESLYEFPPLPPRDPLLRLDGKRRVRNRRADPRQGDLL